MLLKERGTGHLVEVLGINDLFDPFMEKIVGRYSYGEELPDPESFAKADLLFCSDEPLPRCWIDPHYRTQPLDKTA